MYAVTNLRLKDDYEVEAPCVHGIRSRWKKVTSSRVCFNNVGEHTAAVFRDLINDSEDPNPHVKDLVTPSSASCDRDDENTLQMIVQVGGECWKNVHPNHLNVYDFSEWKNTHPGSETNPKSIEKFATKGSHVLVYPTSHAMARWNGNDQKLPYLGRLGDEVDFRDFPDTLRGRIVAEAFGLATPNTDDVGTKAIVCGSPFEVASKLFRTSFSMIRRPESDIYDPRVYSQQRRTVFTMIALDAPDQLRQRVAW